MDTRKYREMRSILKAATALVRTGWMLRGVPPAIGETVADHSFAAALIALELGFRLQRKGFNVDPYRAASIALVHDIGETIIGDIPRVSGIPRREKAYAEARAVESLGIDDNIKNLYREFEEERTLEARIARLSELLSTYLRGLEYEELGYDVRDIIDNMKNEIIEIAGRLGVEEYINDMLGHS